MTTRRQIDANRNNAKASTGPRTLTGKQRSSQNASRHGATRRPDVDQIAAWSRIISGDDSAKYSHSQANTPAGRLAYAEARLCHVKRAEEKCLAELNDEVVIMASSEQRDDGKDIIEESTIGKSPGPGQPLQFTHTIKRDPLFPYLQVAKEVATLARYRAEAEARRSRALRQWIQETKKKSRNDANFNFDRWSGLTGKFVDRSKAGDR